MIGAGSGASERRLGRSAKPSPTAPATIKMTGPASHACSRSITSVTWSSQTAVMPAKMTPKTRATTSVACRCSMESSDPRSGGEPDAAGVATENGTFVLRDQDLAEVEVDVQGKGRTASPG